QVQQLSSAVAHTESRLSTTAASHSAASERAVADLGTSLATFQAVLERTSVSISDASQGAFRNAEEVALEVARRMAEALDRGAGEFERAIRRLAEYSESVESSLRAAQEAAQGLHAHAARFREGVQAVAAPFLPIVAALQAVPGSVDVAAALLRDEHAALQGLGRELQAGAESVRHAHAELGQRLQEYRQLNNLLGDTMARHLHGITGANDQVRQAWSEVVSKSREVVEQTSRQLGQYAESVERSLRLPGDLRNLNDTVNELVDVLQDLHGRPVRSAR
ncbi:MAG: hypothetical protein HYV63_09760, partial [Candidatus Schekmanbacteria bacterium]|nr:hypothetical protein [Candidatus Schekmanbacteria bacterium]